MTPPPYPHLGLSLSVLQGAMRELILSTGEGGSQCGKCVRVRQRLCFHLGPGTAPDSTEIKSIFFPFTLSPDGARSLHGTCEVGMFSGEQPRLPLWRCRPNCAPALPSAPRPAALSSSGYNHFQAEFILLETITPDDINPFWYFLICSIQSGGAHLAVNELKGSNTWKTFTKRLCNALDIACLAQSRDYSRCSIHICWGWMADFAVSIIVNETNFQCEGLTDKKDRRVPTMSFFGEECSAVWNLQNMNSLVKHQSCPYSFHKRKPQSSVLILDIEKATSTWKYLVCFAPQ